MQGVFNILLLLFFKVKLGVALQCYVCGVSGGVENVLTCDTFNPRNSSFIKECPGDYQGCQLATHVSSRTVNERSCAHIKVHDCKSANGVEYCLCHSNLCNENKYQMPPFTDDDEDWEGSGTTVITTGQKGTTEFVQNEKKSQSSRMTFTLKILIFTTMLLYY